MDSRIKRRAILISIGMILLVVLVTALGNIPRLKRMLPDQEETDTENPSEIDSLVEEPSEDDGIEDDAENFAREGFAGSDPSLQKGDDLRAFLEELLTPYLREIDSIVLGCTHYPFVRGVIQQMAGERVRIFDGGSGTAREMQRRLTAAGLRTTSKAPGSVHFENSLATQEEIELSRSLFQKNLA